MHPSRSLAFSLLTLVFVSSAFAGEVFRDLALSGGVMLSNVRTDLRPLETGTVLSGGAAFSPEWRLAQWGTQFDLTGAPSRAVPGGTRIVQNSGKKVTLLPGGLGGEGVTLEVFGSAEFSAGLRKEGEAWPHLLLEQRIPKDFRLARLASLGFRLSFRLERCVPATLSGLDPSLHTAQATAYWTIHNRNRESADFDDMIWFGVPLFDVRHDIPEGHQAMDAGAPNASGKFICTLAGDRFYEGPTGDGQWHELSCDLIPLVQEALASAQEQGHLKATRFDDLDATSFNIGWEVPGPYDCAITLKGLALEAVAR